MAALVPDRKGLRVAMAAATAAAPAAAPGGAAEPAPKQTLYLNNLNEKVKRGELKKTLYATFSQFGRIMQIVCKGSFRLKGQAWIIFDEVTAAAAARRQLNNCPILGKPMVSCRTRSWVPAPVPRRPSYPPARGPRVPARRQRAAARRHPWLCNEPAPLFSLARGLLRSASQRVTFAKEKSTLAATRATAPGSRATKRPRDEEGEDADEPAASRPALNPEATAAATAGSGGNVTLVVSGVPPSMEQAGLAALFSAFPGYEGARLPPGGKGAAFVDFAAHSDADGARRAMDGHDLGEGVLLAVRLAEQ